MRRTRAELGDLKSGLDRYGQYYFVRGDLGANFVTCYEAKRSMQNDPELPRWDVDVCRIELGLENGR